MSILFQNGLFLFVVSYLITLRMNIGGQLKKLRNHNKLSRRELAERLGLSAQQLYKYETGRNSIPVHTLAQIAQMFSVSLDYFVEDIAADQHQALSLKEKELLGIFNNLSFANQKLLLNIARVFDSG